MKDCRNCGERQGCAYYRENKDKPRHCKCYWAGTSEEIKIKCPKCNSEKIEYIDSNHQELMFEDGKGYTDGIYHCPKCRISFGTWTDFKIEITNHTIEWIEEDEEENEDN